MWNVSDSLVRTQYQQRENLGLDIAFQGREEMRSAEIYFEKRLWVFQEIEKSDLESCFGHRFSEAGPGGSDNEATAP